MHFSIAQLSSVCMGEFVSEVFVVHDSLFARCVFQSDLPEIRSLRECKASEIDVHGLSEGMAPIAIENWLSTAVAPKLEVKGSLTCRSVTGYGKSRKAWDTADVRQRVLDLLRKLKMQAPLSSKDLFKLQMTKEQTLWRCWRSSFKFF